ncbi:hypothetical protein ABZ897_60615 [Nonomuraea sp. NPDC046802]|uniref:hypothetical protein n=1 Tax=Nonomuraea sp. NPDC046802 TaxID=3154919 RepID=UPI0033CCA5B4
MSSSPAYTLDYALIEARASELNWSSDEFIRKIGMNPQDLHRVLRPDHVTITWLFRIAEALDLHPGDLITESAPADVNAAAADGAIVETMLIPRRSPSWVSREMLSVALGWPPHRVQAALDTIQERLEGTPLALMRGKAGWAITAHAPSPSLIDSLSAMRRRTAPLSPKDAVHLMHVLRAEVKESHCDTAGLPHLPHLPHPPDTGEGEPGGGNSHPTDNPSASLANACHPDILFALLLTAQPTPAAQPEPS